MSTVRSIRMLPGGHPENGMEPSHLTNADSFTTPNPHETIHTFFTNGDGKVTAGVWECTPCREEIKRYGVDEFMTVLSGSVTVTDADGNAETYTAGDSFVIGADFSGTWEITETIRKFWMIYEPGA